jgi:hypothetical protein
LLFYWRAGEEILAMSPRSLLAAAALLVMLCAQAAAIDLYDGSLGTAPETQGWLAFQSAGGTPTRDTSGGKTTLDTTSNNAIQAGYSNYNLIFPVNPAFPPLLRTDGFVVSMDMRVIDEEHASANRSGVSIIVLASDLMGIELAFWENEVWAQSGADFLHAEGVAFNTTAAMTRYDVAVLGSTYRVLANGNQILTGSLRNYSAFGLPYTLPNFLFLGDDTTSARGSFEFSRQSAVPEPTNVAALAVLVLLASRMVKPRRAPLSVFTASAASGCCPARS